MESSPSELGAGNMTPPLWEDVYIIHHVRGTTIRRTLRKQVHQPKNTPKDWEFEVLTKLLVLGQQPAQTQEPRTHEITFLGDPP